MQKDEGNDYHFVGFDNPTTTPTPDVLFDEFLSILSGAELKVLLYIVRRTFGFKKSSDPISFNQFLRGITTKDGRVLDRGCGLRNRTALSDALKGLLAKGIIEAAKSTDERGENETTVYNLRFKGSDAAPHDAQSENEGVVRGAYHRSTRNGPPVVRSAYPQQTVKQETVKQQNVVVIEKLEDFKIGKEKAQELVSKHAAEYILEKVEFLEWSLTEKRVGRPIKDSAAWLIRAIEDDYQPSDDFKARAEREKEREEIVRQEVERERLRQEKIEQQQQQRAQYLAMLREKYGTTEKELALWPQVLRQIQFSTTEAVYQTWFPLTQLLSLKNGAAVIGVPNRQVQEWFEKRYRRIIHRELESLVGHPMELEFEVVTPPDEGGPAESCGPS